ncbi:MAG: GIY-YIG nuclease family protein [Candidatus Buchananbacteria bacterium]
MEYYVYILKSNNFDRLYIGQTADIQRRLIKHNNGEVRSTKHYIPWQLIKYEVYNTRGEARKRENYLKALKNKKYLLKLTDAG